MNAEILEKIVCSVRVVLYVMKFIYDCCEDTPSYHNIIIINTEKE